MSQKQNKYSTCKVVKTTKSGRKLVIGYLSKRDEERGEDIRLDMLGYEVIAL